MRLLMIVLLLIASTTVMAQDCVIGNTQNVVSFEAGWLGTGVAYAQFTDPITTCFCEHGIAIDEIRISLVLDAGATVRLIAQLLKVNDVAGCDVPGQVLATSGERLVDGITAQGLYEIVIPCDFQCALMADSYFLVVTISEANGGVEMPHRRNHRRAGQAGTGRSLHFLSESWDGLGGPDRGGLQGGLPILALTTCCYDPIGDDFHTWGRVKRIYR
ncbi:MAG: hypothetical protein IPH09_00005 [bacterium]|nr:hypothetical protein [bacterium]